jgi:hypothetical protein
VSVVQVGGVVDGRLRGLDLAREVADDRRPVALAGEERVVGGDLSRGVVRELLDDPEQPNRPHGIVAEVAPPLAERRHAVAGGWQSGFDGQPGQCSLDDLPRGGRVDSVTPGSAEVFHRLEA